MLSHKVTLATVGHVRDSLTLMMDGIASIAYPSMEAIEQNKKKEQFSLNTETKMEREFFDHEERTVEKQWQIYLTGIQPVEIDTHGDAIEDEDFADELDELDLIPESITLNMVSFYFEGTYMEAYNEAESMCEELNENEQMGDSKWEFESGGIMPVE